MQKLDNEMDNAIDGDINSKSKCIAGESSVFRNIKVQDDQLVFLSSSRVRGRKMKSY